MRLRALIAVVLFCGVLIPRLVFAFSLSDFFGSPAEAASGGLFSMPNSKTPALQPARNIDPNPAKGGGDITIVGGVALMSESGPEGTMADIADQKPSPDQISLYVVRPGDTLAGIAKLFGVSSNTILWANDLKSSKDIHAGDTLVILPVTGIEYTVAKGDTVAKIAKKFSAEQNDILNYNGITALTVGEKIIIPDGEIAAVPQSASKGSTGKIYEPAHNVGPQGTAEQIGYYMAPLSHYIETQGIHGYNAVDLAAPSGTSIFASASGTVIVARQGGYNGGYGSYVVIQHANGSQTLYSHMSKVIVSPGASVVQGQIIGYVGMTGKATGPHVHFEIRNGIRNPF